jgi:hypothetical protein
MSAMAVVYQLLNVMGQNRLCQQQLAMSTTTHVAGAPFLLHLINHIKDT